MQKKVEDNQEQGFGFIEMILVVTFVLIVMGVIYFMFSENSSESAGGSDQKHSEISMDDTVDIASDLFTIDSSLNVNWETKSDGSLEVTAERPYGRLYFEVDSGESESYRQQPIGYKTLLDNGFIEEEVVILGDSAGVIFADLRDKPDVYETFRGTAQAHMQSEYFDAKNNYNQIVQFSLAATLLSDMKPTDAQLQEWRNDVESHVFNGLDFLE